MNKQYETQIAQIVRWQFTLDKHLAFPYLLKQSQIKGRLLNLLSRTSQIKRSALPSSACFIMPLVHYYCFQLALLVKMIQIRRAQYHLGASATVSMACQGSPVSLFQL